MVINYKISASEAWFTGKRVGFRNVNSSFKTTLQPLLKKIKKERRK